MPHYDLIVIGSGPAGEKGAVQAASYGRRVAMVEAHPRLGGACVNTGTLPSKTLRESALYLSGLDQRGLYGVDYHLEGGITVDRFLYREEQVVRKQVELAARNIERSGIDLINGRATLVDAHTVQIDKPGGMSLLLHSDYILIATGSYPFRPETIPFDDRLVYDSDSILRLDRIPGSLTVLGGGPIGCEYACIFAALGVEVVLIDRRADLLPFLDREVAFLLTSRMKRLGIEILLQEEAEAVEIAGERVRTRLASEQCVETERFLFAYGRAGSTRGLGLERLGIRVDARGYVQVDENYQTAVPNIYAAGDVIGFPALASTSMEQGRIAVAHAFRPGTRSRLSTTLPYGLYTIPEVSMVGRTEEELRAQGVAYIAGRASYENNARGQIIGDTEGLVKLLFSADEGKLLGVHLIGEDATELVHIGSMVLYHEGTVDCFLDTVFNYPTLSAAFKDAAYDASLRIERLRSASREPVAGDAVR